MQNARQHLTKDTPPKVEIVWDAIPEGIILELSVPVAGSFTAQMPMISVQELADDMEEAKMMARGCERLEVLAKDVQQYDKMYIAADVVSVSDVLLSGEGTVLQFGDSYAELTVDSDRQMTVYRAIE